MPIKGLTDRGLAFPEIGQIRKGKKETRKRKDKSEYTVPVDLTYFRVLFDEKEIESAQIFRDKYGEEPDEINIILPFDEIERCWDAWLEAYTAGRMVARSDGERFTYLIDTESGEILVKNGEPFKPYKDGQSVGKDYKGKDVFCRPVGRLKVIVPELARAAYMTVMTSSIHDIANLSAQLEAFKQINEGVIKGIPLVLRRRPKMISTPDLKNKGQRVRREKYLLSIEADPVWVKAKLSEVKHLSLPGDGYSLLPGGDEDDVIESGFVEDEIEEENGEEFPPAESEKKSEKKKDPGPEREDGEIDIYQIVVDEGLAPDLEYAKDALDRCKTGYDTPEKAVDWMKKFNGWIDLGGTSAQSAKKANEGKKVE